MYLDKKTTKNHFDKHSYQVLKKISVIFETVFTDTYEERRLYNKLKNVKIVELGKCYRSWLRNLFNVNIRLKNLRCQQIKFHEFQRAFKVVRIFDSDLYFQYSSLQDFVRLINDGVC